MTQPECDRAILNELYLTLLLLGAEPMLLASVASWRDGVDDRDVLQDLANWNEAKLLELREWLPTMAPQDAEAVQERIRQYQLARGAMKKAA